MNVIARISPGETPHSRIRYAIRWVRARVLPDARPGDDQDGTLGLEDGLTLDVVEPVEQGGRDAHATMLARARDPTGRAVP